MVGATPLALTDVSERKRANNKGICRGAGFESVAEGQAANRSWSVLSRRRIPTRSKYAANGLISAGLFLIANMSEHILLQRGWR
jgi:hypothetical protein